jgi:transcriptional regulator with XRE-family HTH domain
MARRTLVDPRFGARLRELRKARGLSLRELAARTHFGKSTLSELESGTTSPSEDTAQRLDNALEAGGELTRMVYLTNGEMLDAADRLAYVTKAPRGIDIATVDTLADLLAGQRRLEDSIGSAPLVTPVLAQLATVETLVRDAPDSNLKTRLIDIAGQWAQFAAWLSTTTGDRTGGRRLYLQAMEWATEAGNPHMVATALSMRGHLAWIHRGNPVHDRAVAGGAVAACEPRGTGAGDPAGGQGSGPGRRRPGRGQQDDRGGGADRGGG